MRLLYSTHQIIIKRQENLSFEMNLEAHLIPKLDPIEHLKLNNLGDKCKKVASFNHQR